MWARAQAGRLFQQTGGHGVSAAVILIKTPGPKGLVSRITTFVFEHGFNILDLARAVKAHLDAPGGDSVRLARG